MSNGMFKYDLTFEESLAVQGEFQKKRRKAAVTWFLWLFTGILGGHRFYLRDRGGGLLVLLTIGGFLGIIWLLDAFTLSGRIRRANSAIEAEIIIEIQKKKQSPKSLSSFSGWG